VCTSCNSLLLNRSVFPQFVQTGSTMENLRGLLWQTVYRLDALPVTRPTESKQWIETRSSVVEWQMKQTMNQKNKTWHSTHSVDDAYQLPAAGASWDVPRQSTTSNNHHSSHNCPCHSWQLKLLTFCAQYMNIGYSWSGISRFFLHLKQTCTRTRLQHRLTQTARAEKSTGWAWTGLKIQLLKGAGLNKTTPMHASDLQTKNVGVSQRSTSATKNTCRLYPFSRTTYTWNIDQWRFWCGWNGYNKGAWMLRHCLFGDKKEIPCVKFPAPPVCTDPSLGTRPYLE